MEYPRKTLPLPQPRLLPDLTSLKIILVPYKGRDEYRMWRVPLGQGTPNPHGVEELECRGGRAPYGSQIQRTDIVAKGLCRWIIHRRGTAEGGGVGLRVEMNRGYRIWGKAPGIPGPATAQQVCEEAYHKGNTPPLPIPQDAIPLGHLPMTQTENRRGGGVVRVKLG